MFFNFKYQYYDTPDGQDVALKTFVLSKYGVATGFIVGTMDVLMYSHPKGIFNTAARYMYFTGPLVGMSTAFVVTSSVAQKLRGKDDIFNYFLGGAMAGCIVSAWQKSPLVALPAAIVLGCFGMVKKAAVDGGYELFPTPPHSTIGVHARNDWTILGDLPKTFKTGN